MPHTKEFLILKKSLLKKYLGTNVPKQFQNRYGKIYHKKDINSFAYALAKSKKILIDRRNK